MVVEDVHHRWDGREILILVVSICDLQVASELTCYTYSTTAARPLSALPSGSCLGQSVSGLSRSKEKIHI
jgi:hypothetical protein